jgi:hypothetical protein
MKVIFVCDTEYEVATVTVHAAEIAYAIRNTVFTFADKAVEVEARRVRPSREDLLSLLKALGGPSEEEQDEFFFALCKEQSRRPGSGVHRW